MANASGPQGADGIEVLAPLDPAFTEILTPEALRFTAKLARQFEPVRAQRLEARQQRRQEIRAGQLPGFLPETVVVRESEWTAAPIPRDLLERKVEITGPVERKMIINALNSGAHVFMADFEDSNAPTWANIIQGQINLRDAVRGTIDFKSPEGKTYKLAAKTATLMVRPRGWHLVEKHVHVDGQPVSASLFDFALFFFHNAKALLAKGTAPYFYLPKMESHLEARLWNEVFNFAQDELRIPRGTIRATVLIETVLAAFEMDEILFELKEHSAGLNCGRWDYIFSFIKKFGHRREFLMPDRAQITMDKAFLKAYVELLIKTCHRRRIHAMGGMAAQIPIKNDAAANEAALEKVRQDKLREVRAGHDGTWVAHPALVPVALEIFNAHMKGAHQLDVLRKEVNIAPKELLSMPQGEITENGLRSNIRVGIQYLEAWLRGLGCVPLNYLMEDAATAEISRTQVWQWIHHNVVTKQGLKITAPGVKALIAEELKGMREAAGEAQFDAGRFDDAAELFEKMSLSEECPEFLTLAAYDYLD